MANVLKTKRIRANASVSRISETRIVREEFAKTNVRIVEHAPLTDVNVPKVIVVMIAQLRFVRMIACHEELAFKERVSAMRHGRGWIAVFENVLTIVLEMEFVIFTPAIATAHFRSPRTIVRRRCVHTSVLFTELAM